MLTLNFAEIYSSLKGDFTTLILFGSYARGEQSSKSDLDLLQVTQSDLKSYSFNSGELRINVSVYKPETLENRAKNGDSFVCHILNEGLVLRDDGFVNRLHSLWQRPTHLNQNWLIHIFHRLCVPRHVFEDNKLNYRRSILFLLRSFLYQREAMRPDPTFSIRRIEELRKIPGLVDLCERMKSNSIQYDRRVSNSIQYSDYKLMLTFVSEVLGLASWDYCDEEDAFFLEELEGYHY